MKAEGREYYAWFGSWYPAIAPVEYINNTRKPAVQLGANPR